MPTKQLLKMKREMVEEAKNLLCKYKVLAVADLSKVRANQLQELKKKLRGLVHIKVFKNAIIRRAIEELDSDDRIKKFAECIKGSNIFLFTDMNPYKLKIFLDKNKVKAIAKAGDVATYDVVVPAGNTGLPPGPIISQLNSAGLPTRIEGGSVWINKDTIVARKGDVIDMRLAAVLSKLNIKAVEVGLSLKLAYDNGIILTEKDLVLDLEKVKDDFLQAHNQAYTLSIEVAYPTKENITTLLQKAFREAYSLSLGASIVTTETIPDIIRKAYTEALILSKSLEAKDVKDKSS